jgi:2-methylcitrate dehydratase PrpD
MKAATAITQSWADYVAGFKPGKVPAEVMQRTATMILDGSGALLAASDPRVPTGRLIADFVADLGGHEQATVIGHGFRTNAVQAALANGTMGYACDIEPHHPEGVLHPIAVMIPAALAIGEWRNRDGRDFVAAVALGCEIEYRLSMALGPVEQYDLGFHPSAVCGCFGAAAAAAFLLGLDADGAERAFGLAACQASGMMAWESDPTENARPFQMGVAARNGVTAALLASRGFGGPRHIFDHGHTVFGAFSRSPSLHHMTDDLGSRYDGIMELAIKPYSSVSFLHPGLDSLLGIVEREKLESRDIESITLRFPSSGTHCIDGNPLKSHCAQYILPVAISAQGLSIVDLFEDRRLVDPEVARLSKAVTVVADDELDRGFPNAYDTVIEVRTKSGARYEGKNGIARGYPEAPLSDAEIDAKFVRLAGMVASPGRIAALRQSIAALPGGGSLATYAELMGAASDKARTGA